MMVVYRVANLTKVYKKSDQKANDDLTLDIHEGEIFGLLGPNGAGKSTLVNQLAGLVRPTTGSIELYGIDIVKHPQIIPNYVAIQPQQSIVLNDLYPEEALLYTAQLRGLSASAARQQTADLLEELGLDDLRKKRIRRLSGGQRRLVNLAVTFMGDLPIQIFDEPTNDLDPVVRRLVWEKLLERNRRGTTIILVTHNVLEAERVIQRVGLINHGRLLVLGNLGTLKARVDQRIRLELLFKDDVGGFRGLLETLGETQVLTNQHLTVLCHRDVARHAIDQVLGQIGLERLNDFRILTPSLEDVYVQLGGSKLE